MTKDIKKLAVLEFEDYRHLLVQWGKISDLLDFLSRRIHEAFLVVSNYIRERKTQPIYPKYYETLPINIIKTSIQEAARNPNRAKMVRTVATLLQQESKFKELKRRLSAFLRYADDISGRAGEILNFIKKNRNTLVVRNKNRRPELLSYDEQYILQLALNFERFVRALSARIEGIHVSVQKIVNERKSEIIYTQPGVFRDTNDTIRLFALQENQHLEEELEILDKQILLTFQRALTFMNGLHLLYTEIAKAMQDINN